MVMRRMLYERRLQAERSRFNSKAPNRRIRFNGARLVTRRQTRVAAQCSPCSRKALSRPMMRGLHSARQFGTIRMAIDRTNGARNDEMYLEQLRKIRRRLNSRQMARALPLQPCLQMVRSSGGQLVNMIRPAHRALSRPIALILCQSRNHDALMRRCSRFALTHNDRRAPTR
jgi:hypothetical protein